jgi:hypothetical protein
MSEAWFPASPSIIEQARRWAQDSDPASNTQLAGVLRSDFSLFMHCLKYQAGTSCGEALDASSVLADGSLERLRPHLATLEAKQVSRHDATSIDRLRLKRLIQPVVSASVAAALAPSQQISAEQAYACALFRQLGLALIAWNYPHIYSRAANLASPGNSLEAALSKVLGFSPSMLGVAIAHEWRLSPRYRVALGDRGEVSTLEREAGTRLKKICEIGEEFARATDPDHYPKASGSWQSAANQLLQLLSQAEFDRLMDSIEVNCKTYFALMPDAPLRLPARAGTRALAIEPNARDSDGKTRNPYIKHCPALVVSKLSALYRMLSDPSCQVSEQVETLVRNIIPEAGFPRGCVYLLEPESVNLMPRLAVGEGKVAAYKSVNYKNAPSAEDPVLVAYRSRMPLMEVDVPFLGRKVSYVAGCLGENHLAGVLFLEIGKGILTRPDANPLVYFRALRQALEDCLELY